MGNNKNLGAVTLYTERELNIGTHIFRYIAEDKAGLKSTCEVRIMIKDREAPYFIRCPTDMTIESTNDYEIVDWESPIFKDNSGKDPRVLSSRPAGTRFRVPGKVQVMFVATDEAGNKNTSCKFEINLKMTTCPRHEPPKNGALACLPDRSGQRQCQVYCREGFEFAFRPSLLYYCSRGSWNSFPPFGSGTFPWPDCAERASSSSSIKMSASYYYVGDCNRADVQDDRKKAFISIASDPFSVPPVFCKFNPTCKPNNVNVFCGESSR
ncbi:Hypothetical predicted protein [Paramuricea clavata]|uniref:Uncharacterized protein n=1 Tax=Paramuricea clavata TaxID=317549 RepID=A0A6S7HB90_PARCT|nr:Hypothetical predicted protein [Paramuricea clavata]